MLQFIEEPLVDLRQFVDAVDGVFRQVHGLRDHEHALVRRLPKGGIDIGDLQLLVLHETVHPLADHAQTLLQGFLEVTADGHHFSHTLHRRTEFLIHTTELRQVPTRNLTHHIVEGRLEEG